MSGESVRGVDPRSTGAEHETAPVVLRAFAADCRLTGRVHLAAERLTDLLNSSQELRLEESRVESLADGHALELAELTVERDELLAVVATGPRGDLARRLRTHALRVAVELGPYRVEGAMHGTPAADPLAAVVRRKAWIPLTNATIEYKCAGEDVSEELDTLLVNRALAGSFREVFEESPRLPWESRASLERVPRAFDLTGTLREEAASAPEPAPPKADDPVL